MLKVINLTKQFEVPGGRVLAVRNLNLTVEPGQFFVLLGPSGCGKSSLLRCVAGLESIDGGDIYLGDRLLSSGEKRIFVDPEDREVAMVFQSYAVWPHMTVFENIAFPLTQAKARTCSSEQVKNRVKEVMELVRLSGFERYKTATLSGGQQQRVALARALIREPALLLMDEPLSNLDAKLREEMRDEIKELTQRLGVTTLHVTHDQTEAMALADVLAVMSNGEILETGTPETLYRNPSNRIVAEFLGRTNWVAGTVEADNTSATEIGRIQAPVLAKFEIGTKISVGVRPEWIDLDDAGAGGPNRFSGLIEARTFLGDAVIYWVSIGKKRLMVKSTQSDFRSMSPVTVSIPVERCVVFGETAMTQQS
jgi:iron(III) transport system ATP-binding protein